MKKDPKITKKSKKIKEKEIKSNQCENIDFKLPGQLITAEK